MATFIVHVYDKESKHGTRRDGALIYSTDGAPPRTDYRVIHSFIHSFIHFILDMHRPRSFCRRRRRRWNGLRCKAFRGLL